MKRDPALVSLSHDHHQALPAEQLAELAATLASGSAGEMHA